MLWVSCCLSTHVSAQRMRSGAQVKEEGYEVEHDGYCITVFSAPNYCDQMCAQLARRAIAMLPGSARPVCRGVAGCAVLREGQLGFPCVIQRA